MTSDTYMRPYQWRIYMTSQLFNYVYAEQEKVCASSFFEAVAGAGGVTAAVLALRAPR